jgi:hypothetical protein
MTQATPHNACVPPRLQRLACAHMRHELARRKISDRGRVSAGRRPDAADAPRLAHTRIRSRPGSTARDACSVERDRIAPQERPVQLRDHEKWLGEARGGTLRNQYWARNALLPRGTVDGY